MDAQTSAALSPTQATITVKQKITGFHFHGHYPRNLREAMQESKGLATREREVQMPEHNFQAPGLASVELEALEQQQTEQEFGAAFDSTTLGPESSSQSIIERFTTPRNSVGLGIGLHQKPLPNLPISPDGAVARHHSAIEATNNTSYIHFAASSTELINPHQMGFSFQQGDDADILAQELSRDLLKSQIQWLLNDSTSKSEISWNNKTYGSRELTRRPKLSSSKPHSKTKYSQKGSYLLRDIQDYDLVKRGDSSSSITTAVRENRLVFPEQTPFPFLFQGTSWNSVTCLVSRKFSPL